MDRGLLSALNVKASPYVRVFLSSNHAQITTVISNSDAKPSCFFQTLLRPFFFFWAVIALKVLSVIINWTCRTKKRQRRSLNGQNTCKIKYLFEYNLYASFVLKSVNIHLIFRITEKTRITFLHHLGIKILIPLDNSCVC